MVDRVKKIQTAVCAVYGIRLDEMLGPVRRRNLAWPRQLAMWICARNTFLTLAEIGRRFNRDHTTVIHGIQRVTQRMAFDDKLKKAATDILDGVPAQRLPKPIEVNREKTMQATRRIPKRQPQKILTQRLTARGWDKKRSKPKLETKPRECMSCGSVFQSQGAHNRMCDPCRVRVHGEDYGVSV